MIVLAALLLVVTAQGAGVFATAYIGLRIMKTRHPGMKFVAMLLSWIAWVFITLAGYAATGGSFSLFHGLVPLLMLCATAMASSGVYLIAWMFWPARPTRATTS